ncbi:UNVERIFIED_CONTAM: NUDIX domain-containing protein [Halobacillus marinus]
MKEYLTIFNEDGYTAGTKERALVHMDGDWHETFHCWFYDPKQKSVYFQRRSDDKKDYPGLYDITAAGHIEAGEGLLSAGCREINEELGLDIAPDDLINSGSFKEVLIDGTVIDREICRVFLYVVEEPLAWMIGEEVQDVVRLSFHDFKSLAAGLEEEKEVVSLLSGNVSHAGKEAFVPHEPGYFRFIESVINRYVEKL